MTRQTIVTMTVTGPVDDMVRPWIWEASGPDSESCGTSLTAEDAWAAARDAATRSVARLVPTGTGLADAIRGDQ